MKRLLLALPVIVALAAPAFAVNPDEILPDPALEARARDISAELRCLVCQNQSIDDSDAELARDLRVIVRERLTAGDTNEQVFDYVVSRYGEFVLLKPRFSARTLLLWGFPVLVLLAGAAVAFRYAASRAKGREAALSAAEQQRLNEILGDRET